MSFIVIMSVGFGMFASSKSQSSECLYCLWLYICLITFPVNLFSAILSVPVSSNIVSPWVSVMVTVFCMISVVFVGHR